MGNQNNPNNPHNPSNPSSPNPSPNPNFPNPNPNPPVPVAPSPFPPAAPQSPYPTRITEFKRTKIHNVTVNNQNAPNKAEVINGSGTQYVKEKVHLDTTPAYNGVEYGGNDPVIGALVKEDGKSPCIEWRWFVDGKEASNSAQMPDPFNLGSYEGDGGCTPTLNLQTPVGDGRHQVVAHPFIRAEYNGGLAVQGTVATWYCD